MKLLNYFRQLKKIIVLTKQFKSKKFGNRYYYSYYLKILFKFLICGLFKDEFQIKFRIHYWKYVFKYRLLSPDFFEICLPSYESIFENVSKYMGFKIVYAKHTSMTSIYTLTLSSD